MADIANDIMNRIVVTFDDATSYEVDDYTFNPNKTIVSINTSEAESVTSGNPIGIMTSNSIHLSIIDTSGCLNISKKDGPYYNKIRNGVKIELYTKHNGAEDLYGTYYTTDWGTPFSGGSDEPTSITGKDKLNYIGNKEIPKLPIYSGVPIGTLIKQVFNGVGISDDEYYVDPSLSIGTVFGITVGSRLRDFLNQVAQALVARVVLDRHGVIMIVPALRTYGDQYRISDRYTENVRSSHNSSLIYNKIRVNYKKPGTSELDMIASINGVKITGGKNEIKNIVFDKKVMSIDQVEFIHNNGGNDIGDVIDNIYWVAYQNGIDLSFDNVLSSNIENVNIVIYGCILNEIDSSEEIDIPNSDAYLSNVLEVQNSLIQDAESAKDLANSLSDYIIKMNNVWEMSTQLNPFATTGDRVIIDSTYADYTGNYKIISCRTNFSSVNYSKDIVVVLEDVVSYWDDLLVWDDTVVWVD